MDTGIVKFFNETKGFGFIVRDDGKEIYFHAKNIVGKINSNDKVSFETQEFKRGLSAINVKRIDTTINI